MPCNLRFLLEQHLSLLGSTMRLLLCYNLLYPVVSVHIPEHNQTADKVTAATPPLRPLCMPGSLANKDDTVETARNDLPITHDTFRRK